MKIVTYKPGTRVRTKNVQRLRHWADSYKGQEAVVLGASRDISGMIRIKMRSHTFDVHPSEIESIEPIKLKKFSLWK